MNPYQKALHHYGGDSTIYKAVEAQSRLSAELMRHENGADNVAEIADAVASVQVMTEQIKELFKIDRLVNEHTGRKMGRMERKINGEKWRGL